MTTMITRLRAILSLLVLFSACEKEDVKPATQVLVTVDSDLAVGTDLTSVRVDIRNKDGERKNPEHTFTLTTDEKPKKDEVQLPFSFGVAKQGQAEFQLRVMGLKGSTTVMDLRWSVRFQDETTLGVSVFLGAVCAGKSCGGGETCYPRRKGNIEAGACAGVPAASTTRVEPGDELQERSPEAGSGGRGGSGPGAGAQAAGRGAAGSSGAGAGGRAGGTGASGAGASGNAGAAGCDASKASAFFADTDGDGHGNPSMKQTSCGSAPVGFVTAGDDCCDSDNRAFPGQDQGDVTASTCPEVGFDFDCNGKQEIGWPHLRSGTCCTNTDQPGWKDVVPACGATGQFIECDDQCEVETVAAKQRCY